MKAYRIAVAVTALSICINAQAVVIDLFTINQGPFMDTTATLADNGKVIASGVGSQVTDFGPTILGAGRELWTSLNSGTGSSSIEVANGSLHFSSTAGTVARGQVQWDGLPDDTTAIDYTGLGGIDLTDGGVSVGLALDITSNAAFYIELSAYTDAIRWTTVEFLAAAGSFTYFFPFTILSNPVLCGSPGISCAPGNQVVEINNVGALVLDINRHSSEALDVTIGSPRFVPEPDILSLLGIGLLAVVGLVPRRKKS